VCYPGLVKVSRRNLVGASGVEARKGKQPRCNFATIVWCLLFGVPRTTHAPIVLYLGLGGL
jgi:hypothetical protein